MGEFIFPVIKALNGNQSDSSATAYLTRQVEGSPRLQVCSVVTTAASAPHTWGWDLPPHPSPCGLSAGAQLHTNRTHLEGQLLVLSLP